MPDIDKIIGLGRQPKKDWIKITKKELGNRPIDMLKPGSEKHRLVLRYLMDRVNASERKMKNFYPRWRVSEQKQQAFIDLPEWEKILKANNDGGKPSAAVAITVPYTFATMSTIVTFLFHTLTGRKPLFQLTSHKTEGVANAKNMEQVIQYQAEHTRLVKQLYQFLNDGQLYGVGILRTQWKTTKGMRTKFITLPDTPGFGGIMTPGKTQKERVETVIFEGNEVASIDPFMFLPDPNVPMHEVNKKGEYVFWKGFEGKHILKAAEARGELNWVDAIPKQTRFDNESGLGDESARSRLSAGDPHPGKFFGRESINQGEDYFERIQGTVEIIPAELGLGESNIPEKWVFSIGNRGQIIQAEPFGADHDMHPVSVSEPYSTGYGFGNPGIADYLNPIQDVLSWLVNSHMDNVKMALNNMWVVDPSKIEIQDLKRPGAGKLIRMKRAAYGQNVNEALKQLQVVDVTGSHLRDIEFMMRIGDSLAAVSDNLRGQQDAGGRKTATEARIGAEAGGSRLTAIVRLISAQAIVDLTEQMNLNTQQNISEEFYMDIVGQQAGQEGLRIKPEHIVGDFHYPIHDGTLPLDRVAMLDVWKEILFGVGQDPELRQSFSMIEIFSFVAELGGAKNIEDFKLQQSPELNVVPDQQLNDAVQAGNAIPLAEAQAQLNSGTTPGLDGTNPANRII